MHRSSFLRLAGALALAAGVTGAALLIVARPERARQTATATRTATVSGIVTYLATQQPAPGAKVSLLGGSASTITGKDGRFVLPGLPLGWQTIAVDVEKFITAAATVKLSAGQKAEVTLYLQPVEDHVHAASARVPKLCESCHLKTGEPALIGGTVNAACFGCHQQNYPRFSNRSIFERTPHSGDCTTCHAPHGINNYHKHLLRTSAPTDSNPVCFTCHAAPGIGATADYPGEAEYSRADNPHAHPMPTRVDVYPLAVETEAHAGECYNCHNPHGATVDGRPDGELTPALTRQAGPKLCQTCHTYFGPRVAAGAGHDCTLCHNPHVPRRGGVILLKKPGAAGRKFVRLADFQGEHRGFRLVKDEYCLACHQQEAAVKQAAPDPFGETTAFRDGRNLHVLHAGKRLGAGPTTAEGRIWCAECHDLHPQAPTATNPLAGKLLRSNIIVTLRKSSRGYDGQDSCGLAGFSPCHRGDER